MAVRFLVTSLLLFAHPAPDGRPEHPGAAPRSPYSFSAAPDGSWSAVHPAMGLRIRIGSDDVEVLSPGVEGGIEGPEELLDSEWRLSLRTVAFGYAGSELPFTSRELVQDENRVERTSPSLTEWYVNDARGLEHGWTVPGPPPGSSSERLRIEVEARGGRCVVEEDGTSIRFRDPRTGGQLHYHGLHSWDGTGRSLVSRMVSTPEGFVIEVSSAGASYPITIDPVLEGPVWTAEGTNTGDGLGGSVASAGDVNGDGFPDVLVGMKGFEQGESDEGAAFLYYGSSGGPSATPDWSVQSDQAQAGLGRQVTGVGDVNGDGFDDVLVSAPPYDDPEFNEGKVFLYFGAATGPSSTPDWTAESNQAKSYFGMSIAGAGDVDGDGFDDVLVGAPHYEDGQVREGGAFLYLGGPNGPSALPDWSTHSNQADARLGDSVAGAGDVNGDGWDDIVVGAPRFDAGQPSSGQAYVFLGSPSGPSTTADWTATVDEKGAHFGSSVSSAGDVDGDGFTDLLVGASFQGVGGAVYLYRGSPSGPSMTADWSVESADSFSELGHSVSTAGDVNGDGFDDVVLGAPFFSGPDQYEGRACAYLGSAAGLLPVPSWVAEGDQFQSLFGASVANAGDVDGDGFDDVLVGVPEYDSGSSGVGRALLYAGRPFSDCNGNGIDDAVDIALGTSEDCNGNEIPDECDPDANSNGVPDDCELGQVYCTPAVPNSSGQPGVTSAVGSPIVSDADLTLFATHLPTNKFGYFLVSMDQGFVANPGGSQGNLCLSGQIGRYASQIMNSGSSGSFSIDVDLTQLPPPINDAVQSGETWNWQAWYRDNNPDPTSNFTDAVSITFL